MWSIHHANLEPPKLERTRCFLSKLIGLHENAAARPRDSGAWRRARR